MTIGAFLTIALAIATCARNVTIDATTVIVGEIGLSGEIRAVNNIEARIKEAQKLGFKNAIIPKYSKNHQFPKDIKVHEVSKLFDAITTTLNGN